MLCHHVTLLPSTLLTGTTLTLHDVVRMKWHITACNTKNCGIITHVNQHLTINCTTSGMRALRPNGARGNNNRASVVVIEPQSTNGNETKNTGLIGVSGRANTSRMHNKCIPQPHIPGVQWGQWATYQGSGMPVCDATTKCPAQPSLGVGFNIGNKHANHMVLFRTGNIAEVNVTLPTLFFFHIHCTGLHHNEGGDIHERTIPTQRSLRVEVYSKMSNDVPNKIKPFGTLRYFGAGHLGHYETFLYGHRLGPFGTLRDFFLGHYKSLLKIFLRALRPPPLKLSKIFFGSFAPPPPLLES